MSKLFLKRKEDQLPWPSKIQSVCIEEINTCPIYSGEIDFSKGNSNKLSFARFILGVLISSGNDGLNQFFKNQKHLYSVFKNENITYELIKLLNNYSSYKNINEEEQINQMEKLFVEYPNTNPLELKESSLIKYSLNNQRFKVLSYFLEKGFKHYDEFLNKNLNQYELLLISKSSAEVEFILKSEHFEDTIKKLNKDEKIHLGFWLTKNSNFSILYRPLNKIEINKMKSLFDFIENKSLEHQISLVDFHFNTLSYLLKERKDISYNSPEYIYEYIKWLTIKHPSIFDLPSSTNNPSSTINKLLENVNDKEIIIFLNLNIKNSINNNLPKKRF